MSTGGVHKMVLENRQIQTTQSSALHCSFEQEISYSSNLEVWNNLEYGMTLEVELQGSKS